MNVNRFEFFINAVIVHHLIQLGMLSVWGHFYSRRKIEPTDWKVSYSTAEILSKLSLGTQFKIDLKVWVDKKITEKSEFVDLAGIPERLLKLSKVEVDHLTSAQTYLK